MEIARVIPAELRILTDMMHATPSLAEEQTQVLYLAWREAKGYKLYSFFLWTLVEEDVTLLRNLNDVH